MSDVADNISFQYPPVLGSLIGEAISRLKTELGAATPVLGGQVIPWLHYLAGQAQPEDYFKHPLAFPSLLLSWWLEESLSDRHYLPFQADLVYSTLNGYYHIRLIDNLMDHQATVELNLLPALNFFHTQFQMAYQRYFEPRHPFWDFFRQVWFHSAEVTMQDAALTGLDETEFRQIAAKKTSAAKIPLAATCYHYERPDLIEPWSELVDRFGCWHQFLNDLFDWHKDSTRQVPTYFLTEAEQRRRESETLLDWVIREGFSWGIEKLAHWMVELRQSAHPLNSTALLDYLDVREKMLLKQRAEVTAGLENMAKLLKVKK